MNEPLDTPTFLPFVLAATVANTGGERDAFNRPYKVGWCLVHINQAPYIDGDDGKQAWSLRAMVNLTKEATDQLRELGGLHPNERIHLHVQRIEARDGKTYKTPSGEKRKGSATVNLVVDRIHLPSRPDRENSEADAEIERERAVVAGATGAKS